MHSTDLVVLTTHGHSGVARVLLGSVAAKLAQHSPVPLVVVPALADEVVQPQLRTVVVPLDGSANGEAALPMAVALGRRTGCRLRLVQVPTVAAYLTIIPDTAPMIPAQDAPQTTSAIASSPTTRRGIEMP